MCSPSRSLPLRSARACGSNEMFYISGNCVSEMTSCSPCQYLHSTISFLKVDEGIIFEFLHSLQLAKLTEGLLQQFLCDTACQVPHE